MGASNGMTAVITGGGSGLGRALALEVGRRGGRVLVSDVNEAGAARTAELVLEAGAEARSCAADVRSPEAVEALAARAEAELGAVDLVVNNAGVAVSGKVGEVDLDDWRWVVDVNLWGVIHGCHAFVPRFVERGRGYVLNVASAAGLLSPPELAPYNVTKAGVIALSETLHAEVRGRGVHVTVLCPTFFRTNLMDAARGPQAHGTLAVKLMERAKVQAEDVAKDALDAVEAGRLYAVPMTDGRALWRLKRAIPQAFARSVGWLGRRRQA